MFDDLREAWGAAPATNPTPVDPSKRTEIFAHWNGPAAKCPPDGAHQRCLDFVKAVQAYHQGTRGWSDVGYNAFVCQHGRSIEGRGVDIQGAHCPDHNISGVGIQITIGEGETPTPEALSRFARLRADIEAHVGRTLTPRGHRDGAATTCPGDDTYSWVTAGMPDPLEDELTTAQYDALMAAINGVSAALKTAQSDINALKTTTSSTKTAVTTIGTDVTETRKVVAGNADELIRLQVNLNAVDLNVLDGFEAAKASHDDLAAQAAAAVRDAINQSLGGVEVTARYTRTTP